MKRKKNTFSLTLKALSLACFPHRRLVLMDARI